jgi:ribonuclease III
MDEALAGLIEQLGYTFQQEELLLQALTHRSLVNELGEIAIQHNERLEFLGDAVVDLSVGHQLMERLPEAREGDLSKLRAMVVSEAGLAFTANQVQLGNYLRLGRGEEHTGGRKKASILADSFEALFGAIYLDGGFVEADRVARRLLGPLIDTAVDGDLDRDYKTRLQELVQAQWHIMPRYEVVGERGPVHAKVFTVAVFLEERELAHAEGHSKKAAEQRAARHALAALKKEPDPPSG